MLSQAMTLFGTYFVTTASHSTTAPDGVYASQCERPS